MLKLIERFFYWRELWACRALTLSHWSLCVWVCLGDENRASDAGMCFFIAAVVVSIFSGLYSLILAQKLINEPRMPDVSYAIHRDWMITRRGYLLMALLMFTVAIYVVSTIAFWDSTFHWLANCSVATSIFILWKAEKEESLSTIIIDGIRQELIEKDFYDEDGKIITHQ
ncbi:MAG: hypothetical protein ACD_67C00039G0004 [uncultured bacterium]|nr:MAG: hypothetical protein ACD_67C00039G0004 [uncultured bacterium]